MLNQIIADAIQVLKNGGVILYPTDTIWGIGCDATNTKAIEKIYQIKKRKEKKPLIILVHDTEKIKEYIHDFPEIAHEIINKATQPTTIIYERPINLSPTLMSKNSIGIRVIKNNNINTLLKKFNKAITSTSANISSFQNPKSFSEIDSYIKNNVDYIVPENFMKKNNQNKGSRIIKIINNSQIKIIRK
ncbi:MAG: threonylcarbamoyl-AMP synthase [Flavobacteriales bacterium]|nr:threonylcarbamoyl-AMP synthase [Flavobacteriales bacterium]|tara:strand:+ start:3191 stop:3757 length:567 start_codon:yes stop_codon:yes gene_type:complete